MAISGTKDILGRTKQVVNNAFSSDQFQIGISGSDKQFMLVQNFEFQYAQQVTRVFDLESAEYQAYVASRPQGQMTISNVVAKLGPLLDFMQEYGDVCAVENKNIVITLEGRGADNGLCRQQGGSLSFSQPVLISTAMSIAVADYMVNNNMEFIFAAVVPAGSTEGTTN